MQEQDKCIKMAREAERCLTEIRLFKQQAEKSEAESQRYRQEVEDVKAHSLKIESERYKGTNFMTDRFETQKLDIE
jgi:hypothetical protein